MKLLKQLSLCLGASVATTAAAATVTPQEQYTLKMPKIDGNDLLPTLAELQGFPGVLSRETVQEAINVDIRNKILAMYEQGNDNERLSSKSTNSSTGGASASTNTQRELKDNEDSNSFDGLNEFLAQIVIDIPEQNIQEDILGTTATVNVAGTCGGLNIANIGLDYKKGGSSLTYNLNVDDVDVKCQILLDWDLGVLDVSDKLKIRIVLLDNDFKISVTLNGSPPETATFNGCEAGINVNSISASGGFSANILNDLEDLILNIVAQETEVISDIICDLITSFTDSVNEVLASLSETLAPYLTRVIDVDPLELENNLETDVELLDFTDSTLGEVIQVFIDNLDGVVGAFQINTLIELNLLDENGVFTLDLDGLLRRRLEDEDEDPTEECSFIRRRELEVKPDPALDLSRRMTETLEEELTNMLRPVLPGVLERELQATTDELFVVNEFDVQTVEVVGLNTFVDTNYLEIIGEQTLRSVLQLKGLAIRVTLFLDATISGANLQETIVATVPIDGIDVTASFLVGLDKEQVESWSLGTFVATENILPCVISSLVVAGLSELSVTVEAVSKAQVQGVLDTGVDNLINTAVEAALCTYQDLILIAVPNIFQNNVTVIVNDFLECYIRTEQANSVCPEAEGSALSGLLGLEEDDTTATVAEGESVTFTFGADTESSTTFFDYTSGTTSTATSSATPDTVTSDTTSSPSSTTEESSLTGKSGSFLGTDSSYFQGSVVPGSNGVVNGFIDFRDLLLSADEAKLLGGSGKQPYGNLISMAFNALKAQMVSIDNTTGLPTINSFLIQPLTESQSGTNGLLRFPERFFNMTVNSTKLGFLQSLLQRVEISAFDARIENLNTIVSPIKFLEPTDQAHVLENIFHFGPVDNKPLNMTLSLSVNLEGQDSPLALSNEIDISAFAKELDIFTNFRIMIPEEKFLQFPLTDILNFNCWLALIQAPNMDLEGDEAIDNALAIKSFIMKVVSMAMDLKCADCTSTSLPRVIEIFEEVGATEVLGDRLGGLLEEIMTSDVAPVFLTEVLKLGEEAALLCPHSPTFNTTTEDYEGLSTLEMPPLSSRSIDTITFASILGAELLAVVFAESHLRNIDEPSDGLSAQTDNEFEGFNLLDFTNLEESPFFFAKTLIQTAKSALGGNADESGSLGINQLLSGFLGEGGEYTQEFESATFEVAGAAISIHAVHITGLDSFASLNILEPIAPQTMKNTFTMDKLSLKLDLSVNVTTTADPPLPYTVSLDLNDLDATAFLYMAVDVNELNDLQIGALLYLDNILPCLLSTTYDIRIPAIEVMVGSISKLAVGGLLPETSEMVSASIEAMFQDFGAEMSRAINLVFDGTVKTLINGYLESQETECKQYAIDTASRYVDFRAMFWPDETESSLYGNVLPFLKDQMTDNLLSLNPATLMPKINDVLIAPLTKSLSGVAGLFSIPGELFGFNYQGLQEIGIENVDVHLHDAQAKNLDTFGPPFVILEPNKTDASLLDNRATLGTELRPLHFGVKTSFSLNGSLIQSDDEIELFGELKAAPFLAVLLARIGTQEFLTYPLQYVADFNCWIATIAAPALEEIGRGETQVDPVLAIPYVEMLFSSIYFGASCDNCTTPGMKALPDLLKILEDSGTMDIIGRRSLEIAKDLLGSDFTQAWFMKIMQDSVRNCARTEDMEENSIVLTSPEFPEVTSRWLETGAFAVSALAQTGAVILAETLAALEGKIEPVFETIEADIPEGTRMVDFTALDTYPIGGLVKYFIDGANAFLGEESIDTETGDSYLGVNDLLGDNPLYALDSFSTEFDDLNFIVGGLTIALKEVTISGIDTFTSLRVMDITGPNTIRNELGWKKLQLDIALEVDAGELNGFPQTGEKVAYSLSIEAEDIETSLEMMLALDYELLTNLQMGSLLRMSKILPCIQATVRQLEITDVIFNIGRISKLRLSGFESEEVSAAAESFERLLLDQFGESLSNAAPSLFSVAVRPLMNNAMTSYLRNSDFKCNEFLFNDETSGFIDFRDMFLSSSQSIRYGGSGAEQYGDLLRTAYGLLQLQLYMADPDEGIEMLAPLLGDLSFPGVLLNQGIRFDIGDIRADVTLRISDFEVQNLDSLGKPLSLLSPVKKEAHQLNNSATLGIGNRPVSAGARFYMHIKGLGKTCRGYCRGKVFAFVSSLLFTSLFLPGDFDIANDFSLSLDIHAATMVLTALLKVSEMDFVKFPLRDCLNLNCWLALIPPPALDEHGFREIDAEPTASLTNLDVVASKLNMELKCHNCTSPALFELGELLKAPGSSEDMTALANRVIKSATGKLGGAFLQDQINRLLVEAPRRCGHNEGFDPDAKPTEYQSFQSGSTSSSTSFISMMIVILVPLLCIAATAIVVKHIVRRRQKKWLLTLPSERVFLIQQQQNKRDQEEAEINDLTSSMYRSDTIPYIWRQLVPIIVVVNIAFFLSGHLNKGGRILVNFVFAGETFTIDDFFIFSIGQSTVDMWHAGGKELALLILLFSGVWPYTKQLITLALWFSPPSLVPCTRRGKFLTWLDILAKWSMIDIIVMLITVAGFR